MAEAEEAAAPSTPPSAPRKKPSPVARNLSHLPETLPRIEPQSTLCPCGYGEMVRISGDRTNEPAWQPLRERYG